MSTGTTSAYGHPKLNELIQQATATPFIGQVLVGTVRDLVHPQDRILVCYYLIETSGATADRDFTYYSIDVVLVTTAYFIRINFFPKTHTYSKKRIHTVADLKVEYPAPPMEELTDIKAGDFLPSRISLSMAFQNDRGGVVENWATEASDLEQVRQLMEISRLMGRVVGLPLAQAATPATP